MWVWVGVAVAVARSVSMWVDVGVGLAMGVAVKMGVFTQVCVARGAPLLVRLRSLGVWLLISLVAAPSEKIRVRGSPRAGSKWS